MPRLGRLHWRGNSRYTLQPTPETDTRPSIVPAPDKPRDGASLAYLRRDTGCRGGAENPSQRRRQAAGEICSCSAAGTDVCCGSRAVTHPGIKRAASHEPAARATATDCGVEVLPWLIRVSRSGPSAGRVSRYSADLPRNSCHEMDQKVNVIPVSAVIPVRYSF